MKKLAILLFGVFAFSTSAQAITWDFAAEGDRVEDGYATFVTGVTNSNIVDPGITIRAYNSDGDRAYVYLDGDSPDGSGYEGGLGVCSDIDFSYGSTSGNCGSDDNQVVGETVKMTFDSKTHISSMVLTGDHTRIRRDTVLHILSDLEGETTYDIGCDGFGCQLPQFEDFLSLLVLDITADEIKYWITGLFDEDTQEWGTSDARIYLVEMIGQVPVPAAVWLFGTAMLGLFGLRRKTKAEALAA